MTVIRRARAADAPAIGRVHVETWQAAYAGLLPDSMLTAMSDVRQSAIWQRLLADPAEARGVFVADDPDMGVVGFGCCGPVRDPPEDLDGTEVRVGEVYTLYVEPDFQNLGLGRRLLDALFRQLRADGHDTAVLWMLAPTRRASSTRAWAASASATASTPWPAATSRRSPTPGATSTRRWSAASWRPTDRSAKDSPPGPRHFRRSKRRWRNASCGLVFMVLAPVKGRGCEGAHRWGRVTP